MKKKSQQTLKHKPPNIFNLVTKVFLALLMIVTATFTGITGSSGIDLAKPASASSITRMTYSFGDTNFSSGNGYPLKSGGYDYSISGITMKGSFALDIDSQAGQVSLSSFNVTYTARGFSGETISTGSVSKNDISMISTSYINISNINGQSVSSSAINGFINDYEERKRYGQSPQIIVNFNGGNTSPLAVQLKGSLGFYGSSDLTANMTTVVSSGGGGTGCTTTPGVSGTSFVLDQIHSGGTSLGSYTKNGKRYMPYLNGTVTMFLSPGTGMAVITDARLTITAHSDSGGSPETFSLGKSDITSYSNAYFNMTVTTSPSTLSSSVIDNFVSTASYSSSYSGEVRVTWKPSGVTADNTSGHSWSWKVASQSSSSYGGGTSGNCSTPPPTTTTVYPKTCASGLTPKGTPGTSSFYCEKPVKQTEIKNPDFIKDINLGDIIAGMGDYGSTGDRGDGQFNLDSGNHNNGWYLNGNGDAYKSDHVQFTNVPDNGYVNAMGDKWSPEYLVTQGKNKIEVPLPSDSTTVEKQKRDTSLSNFKSTGSLSEVIAYKVTDLEALKAIQDTDKGLPDLFSKTGSTYSHDTQIVSHKVDQTGEGNYSDFKINESGYYILGTKYIDMVGAKKESASPNQSVIDKYTYYSFFPVSVNFMSDLGYLPIHNNLLTQLNDSILTVGNKKTNHKLGNLSYQTYKSMKVPSAYNYSTDKTLIGSTSGGLQLLNKDLSPVSITDNTTTMDSAKINSIVEYDKGFYLATDKGILYLNCEDNSLNKTNVTESVNDLELYHDSLYYITDTRLSVLFADGANLIKSSNEYDLTTMFSGPTIKAGRVEVLNGLLTISSKDDSTASEVITLNK